MAKKHSRGRLVDGTANPIDVFVGRKIRLFRQSKALSQEDLAVKTGVTFQQIQKYERGANRVSASRLWDLCVVLGVGPDDFFEGIGNETDSFSPRRLLGIEGKNKIDDPFQSKETVELVEAFYKIENLELRQNILLSLIAFSKTPIIEEK